MTVSLKIDDFGSFMMHRITDLEEATKIKLSLAEKIVLSETGTVEQALSILTNSKIAVKILHQKVGRKSIYRESLIVNSENGENLICARSKITPENLPEPVIEQIKLKRIGIGSIISKFELETFRKIVEIGYKEKSDSFFRKYQIRYKNKVTFEIEEELLFRKNSFNISSTDKGN